ncbi:MAG: M23 family metallopeptidase [Rickettsiales bacterium]|nr:M23 family metallopeptidase [Rickettsiales bacterium]
MKKYLVLVPCLLSLSACDLRQKIVDMPGNIGDFIASRYPALLADPDTEIYEYASVLDYGNSNTADMYGTEDVEYGRISDYVSYADSDDYVMPTQTQTISDVSKDYGTLVVAEKKSFVLSAREIDVEKGDTAYSIAKKYNMPIARLAVLNGLSEPYQLKAGQRLKVETAEIITTKTEITKTEMSQAAAPKVAESTPIITSNSAIRLPKLSPRSGSKFAWPARGKIISDFGPKRNGLTNEGINIGAALGTTVSSADNGVVAYAGNELKGMGNLLIIQHTGGWMTVYAHLDNFIVRRGDKVSVGQKVGTVGQTGKVSEPQLHFEIRKGAKSYDPKKQLK